MGALEWDLSVRGVGRPVPPAHIGNLIRRLPALFERAWLVTVLFRSDLYPDWYRPLTALTISAK
jgi:hypothetical protein